MEEDIRRNIALERREKE